MCVCVYMYKHVHINVQTHIHIQKYMDVYKGTRSETFLVVRFSEDRHYTCEPRD